MAHPQDKIFSDQMGGRTVKDDKDEHLAAEKPTLTERLKKASEDALEARMTAQIYGGTPQGGEGGGEKPESLQASVVTSALTQMNNMVSEANMMAKEKEKEVIQARREADEARANLFTAQLVAIKNMQDGLAISSAKAAAQGTPEAMIATIEKYGTMMEKLKPKVSTASESVAATGVTDAVRIEIEKMRQGHAFAMKGLELQMLNQNNQFSLQMAQFEEDSKRRWREYEDGRDLKQSALGGFGDLASAISAGISRERGGPTGEEEVIQASVGSFPCEFCKTMVPVNGGASKAVCPNTECGASYNIKKH